jgi:hypothetical protein
MTAIRRQKEDSFRSRELAGKLDEAGTLLAGCISPDSPLTQRMKGLRERLVAERLHLAVLGQFKRGKSTFLNALLGAPLLPTGVVPLTAVATFIMWGAQPLIRVFFRDGRAPQEFSVGAANAIRDCLFRFVAEEANPNNRFGVTRVELLYPAPILSDGTVLIDTPGVGSTLKHNTDAAREVLPECDAALFVLSADPPITEIELEYLRGVKTRVSRIFFILNKIDYLAADERKSAVDFLRNVLSGKSLIEPSAPLFCVSARQGIEGKERKNRNAVDGSGIAGLEDHLVHYLATEKVRSLEDAVRRKAAELLGAATAELELRAQALRMPLDELQSKSAAFEAALRSIEEQRRVTCDLLVGDQRRLRQKLESTIEILRTEASSELAGAINTSLAGPMPSEWQTAAQGALASTVERLFDRARGDLAHAFAQDTAAALSSHQHRIDALVVQVERTAAEIFDVALARGGERDAFKLGEDPYWVTERIGASLIPDVSRAIDLVLPVAARRARVRARLVWQADQLVIRNAENLRWAILRGLDETFRSAAAQLEERLDDAIAATRGVIKQVLVRRQDRSFAARPEIERLGAAERSVKTLLHAMNGDAAAPDISSPVGSLS